MNGPSPEADSVATRNDSAAVRKAQPGLGPYITTVFVIGAIVGIVRASVPNLWYDECLTYGVVAAADGWREALVTTESSPPAYFALAYLLSSLVPAFYAIRALSVACWLLAVFVVTRWAVGRFSRDVGLLACAFAVFNPFGLWYATEARPYAMLVLATTLVTLAIVEIDRRRAARHLYLSGSLLAICTHYFAAFFVAVAAAMWATRILLRKTTTSPAHPNGWRAWFMCHGVLAVAALPLLLLLRTQLAGGHTEYIPRASILDLARTYLIVFPFGLDAAIVKPMRLAGAAAIAGLLLVATVYIAIEWKRIQAPVPPAPSMGRESDPPTLWEWTAALVLFLVPPCLLFAFSALVRPVFLYDRYPIMSLPALWVLVSLAARASQRSELQPTAGMARYHLATVTGAIVGCLVVCSVFQTYRYSIGGAGDRVWWSSHIEMTRGPAPRWSGIVIPDPKLRWVAVSNDAAARDLPSPDRLGESDADLFAPLSNLEDSRTQRCLDTSLPLLLVATPAEAEPIIAAHPELQIDFLTVAETWTLYEVTRRAPPP